MRRTFLCICSIVMVVIYMISSMGLGLHECRLDGTKKIIVFFGESPCEYSHSHIDENGNIYSHSHSDSDSHFLDSSCKCTKHHDNNCCKTISYVLSDEQLLLESHSILVYNQVIAIQPDLYSYKFDSPKSNSIFYANYCGKYRYRSVDLPFISQFLI